MVDIKKDDDLARPSRTLAHPRRPSPTLAPSFNLATLSTLATLVYTLHLADSSANRELTILGRERRPRLHKTKTAITEIKTVQLCRKYNLKDLLSA